MSNAKNYTEQGGDKTVIGGTLEINGTLDIKEGATVTGLPAPTITKAAYQAHSLAAKVYDLAGDFNDLLDKLIAAGLMEDAPSN